MKSDASILASAGALDAAWKQSLPSALCELFKLRLTLLVLFTTLIGFYVGCRGPLDWVLMIHTLLGTAILASGAAAFNELLEREQDAKMRRTQKRPLPTGRFTPNQVLVIGAICSAAGLVYLALGVHLLCAEVGAATVFTYIAIYTPLKRLTVLNTVVGAVPGALPILIGWTAARGEISGEGWSLFAIVFFWQLPHFLAIAWIYRDDFAKAGFRMLPAIDQTGERTGRYAVCHTVCLLLVGVCPFLLHLAGKIYLAGALVLGFGFLWYALRFALDPSRLAARRLFHASIVYLPLLLGLMAAGRVAQ